MPFPAAPFHQDIARSPGGGTAYWLGAEDGVRLRIGLWQPEGRPAGTVLMFPGRTEYIEKYGDAAREFVRRGYVFVAIDWRGQGLADRLLDDVRMGHVVHFRDYQMDVAAMLDAAARLDLPGPMHLLGHSMGGAIGLRAAIEGAPVVSCAFTGPMWGIHFSTVLKPLSRVTAYWGPRFGLGHRNPPTTKMESYVQSQPFEGNMLTRDSGMYQMMRDQLEAVPALALGAPSIIWLREALGECRWLAKKPAPDLPCLTFMGGHEQIVDREAIRTRMAGWPRGRLIEIPDGEHEVLMEAPEVRGPVYARIAALFAGDQRDKGRNGALENA